MRHDGGGVVVGGEEDARHVERFAQHRLGHHRVLVGLLVLGVLPSVGRQHQRYGQPSQRAAVLVAVVGEDDLLPDDAVHLRTERLVGDDDIDASLVGQGRRGHGLLVEGGDHRSLDVLRDARLGIRHPEFEGVQSALHAVGPHLVWVAHPRTEVRVGLDDGQEGGVHRVHR